MLVVDSNKCGRPRNQKFCVQLGRVHQEVE